MHYKNILECDFFYPLLANGQTLVATSNELRTSTKLMNPKINEGGNPDHRYSSICYVKSCKTYETSTKLTNSYCHIWLGH